MRVLVTGANGQLGLSLRRLSEGSAHEFIFTDVSELEGFPVGRLDICDRAAVLEAAVGFDAIVNCAAYTNVDRAEDDEVKAELLNCTAPANLAAAAEAGGALLVHISTDYVFGAGVTGRFPLPESASTLPQSAYGRTKLHGEQAIRASGCRHIIIRTAWLYSEFGKNFVKTMLRLAGERPVLKVVDDQFGTPTYAGDLAEAILRILERWSGSREDFPCGTYHFTDEGECNWYRFATEILRLAGCSATVEPCSSDEYPSKVHRPSWSVLDKTLIKETFGIGIPAWEESLRLCLNNILE